MLAQNDFKNIPKFLKTNGTSILYISDAVLE